MLSSKLLRQSCAIVALAVIFNAWVSLLPASAAVLTWSKTTAGSAVDGAGTWSTSSNWWTGSVDQPWNSANNDTAVFGAAAGSTAYTVNVSGSQTVGGITFQSQAYTLSGGTINLAGSTPTIMNASGGTITSVLTGTAGLTKSGTGALMLSGANTFSGGMTISAGTVAMGNASALGSGTVTVNGTLSSATPYTVANSFAFNGGTVFFTNGSSGPLHLGSGTNGSTINIGAAGATIRAAKGFNTNQEGEVLLDGQLTGSGPLSIGFVGTGAGGGNNVVVHITNNTNTYSGTVSFVLPHPAQVLCLDDDANNALQYAFVNTTSGDLELNAANATIAGLSGNGSILPYYNAVPGSLDLSSYLLTVNGTSNTTYGGVMQNNTGQLGLALSGGGTLTLTNTNTYSSGTTINAGILQLGNGAPGNDGSISNTNSVTNNAALVYNLFGNQSASYAISGSGNLTKLGQGQLTLIGNNSYTGTTTVSGGVLNINGGDTSTGIVVSGGSLYVNAASSAPSVSVAGGATLGGIGSLASAGANVANGGILDFSQNISGSPFNINSVTYAGSSTLNLGALANYMFAPVLSVGALSTSGQININANLGAVSILSGTYDLVSFGSIAGTGTSAFHLASLAGLGNRQSASLIDVSNQIEVVVGGATPYWNGNQPDWLSNNSWTLQPGGSLTSFQTGDADIFDDTAGTGTYGGTVLLNSGNVSPGSMVFNNSGLSYTVSGNYGIAGTGALTVQGGGSVTIVNSNSYTGGTTISNGMLQLGNGGATGSLSPSGAITLGSNGTLIFSRSNDMVQGIDFGGPISGSGSVIQSGLATVILTTSNTFTGTTTINGGTLQLGTGVAGQDGSLTGTSGVSNYGTLAYNLAGSQTASYTISGGGNLEKNGSGTLTLTTAQTYAGGTTVNGGTLNAAGPNAPNQGAIGATSGLVINSGGTVTVGSINGLFGYGPTATGLTVSTTANAGSVLYLGSSGLTAHIGPLTLAGGTLASADAGNATFGGWNLDGGITVTANSVISALRVAVSVASPATFTINPGVTLNVTGYLGNSNIPSSFVQAGAGTMILSGSNTYTGSTTINGGTLQLGTGQSGQDGAINSTSGVLNNDTLVYAIAGTQTSAYAISGSGNLSMIGSGIVALTASNSYTGTTTVNAGTLYVNGTLASPVTVSGGTFGGGATAPGASVATAGGIEGGYNGTGTMTLGTLNYAGSGSFTTNGYANYPAAGGTAPLNVTGSNGLNLGGGTITVNLGGAPAVSSGTYHLIEYSGAIGGSGFAAFTLSTAPNTPRGQLSYSLVNDPGYVDAAVTVTPVIWTGSLSTEWYATDTLPAPMNWSYSGSGTNFLAGDIVQFDNSTTAGGTTVDISNGNVLPGAVQFNNDSAHPYTLTGTNSIGGSAQLVKNGFGSVTIGTSNSYSGGTTINAGLLEATNSVSPLGTGTVVINGGTLQLGNGISGNDGALSATNVVTDNAALVYDLANSQTASYTISGSGSVTNAGPGSLTLSGSNTFSGGTTIAAGTVALGNAAALGSGTVTVIGTLSSANSYSLTNSFAFNGGTVFYTNGSTGPLHLGSGTNGSTINIGAAGATIRAAKGFNTNLEGEVFLDGQVTGSGPLSIGFIGTGAGGGNNAVVHITNNANTYNGTVNFVLPHPSLVLTLVDEADNALQYATVNSTSGDLELNTANPTIAGLSGNGIVLPYYNEPGSLNLSSYLLTVNGTSNSTFGGVLQNNVAQLGLALSGGGMLTLTNTSTYSGGTTISAGTLQLGNGASGNDGSIGITSGVTNNAALVYNLFGNQYVSYTISGSGSLTQAGPGQMTLGSFNSYSGGTRVSGGTLQLGTPGALGTGGLTANAGVVDLNGQSPVSIASLSGSSGIITDTSGFASNVLTVAQESNTTFSGSIQDGPFVALGLTMSGTGQLTLSGSNSFSGGMNVQSGELILDGAASLLAGSSLTIGSAPSPGAVFAPPSGATVPAAPAVAPVPEPGTLVLLTITLLCVVAVGPRRFLHR